MGVAPPAYEAQAQQNTAPYPHDPSSFGQPPFQQPQHTGSQYSELQAPQSTYHAASPQQKSAPAPAPMAHANSQGYAPQMNQMHQGGQPTPIPLASLMQVPNWAHCPSCNNVQVTRVEFVSGTSTHLWAAALCCCFCLGCIPYCVSSLKDVEHHCGHCGTLLATYKRGKGTEVNAGALAPAAEPKK